MEFLVGILLSISSILGKVEIPEYINKYLLIKDEKNISQLVQSSEMESIKQGNNLASIDIREYNKLVLNYNGLVDTESYTGRSNIEKKKTLIKLNIMDINVSKYKQIDDNNSLEFR